MKLLKSEIKLCKNCKYSSGSIYNLECHHKKNSIIDLSHGGYELKWPMCYDQRADGLLISIIIRTCGKSGRWFESKNDEDI